MKNVWIAWFVLLLASCNTNPSANASKRVGYWIGRLRAPDVESRAGAAEALGKLGADARVAVPALQEALRDKESRVRLAAAVALWKVDRRVNLTFPVIAEAVADAWETRRPVPHAVDAIIKDAQREAVVLTRGGKAAALVVGVAGLDLE